MHPHIVYATWNAALQQNSSAELYKMYIYINYAFPSHIKVSQFANKHILQQGYRGSSLRSYSIK